MHQCEMPTLLTLKDLLQDWADQDGAMYELARSLGLIDPDATFTGTKGLWWTAEPLGNLTNDMLRSLAKLAALELRYNGSDDQFRWNPNWKVR